ncbi:PIG-L deacetylase family protein [Thermoactinomyces mirandus]|uniref:PIG-L family deacetylase n=1 Tax=Thermoactinomyces mirandus TaxID=2756294 RepID=A0A7W2ASS2_9BACL|nr:PIG-L family deacetylase [Thermoactinomyces mirandus]MBA4603712.1 PIG-L family deacetylase [Thermoactinomyces mirandus]
MSQIQTILYVFAHPDDETFSCGGTICHFHQLGMKQTLFCATHGEAGKTGNPQLYTQNELGNVRLQELQNALSILGMDRLIIRNWGDGRLSEQPFLSIVNELHSVMEEIRPDRVITFPPSGISGHPDHKVIQKATIAAIQKISFPIKLYYIVIPESIAHLSSVPVLFTPDEYVSEKIDVTPYHKKIIQALSAHKNQHLSVEKIFSGIFVRLHGSTA